jgi:hypothetical protein
VIVGSVLLDEYLLLFCKLVQGMDGIRGANGHARAAINAAFRIHIHLRRLLKTCLVLLGMNAIGRADIGTECVLDTGISDYIGHDSALLEEIPAKSRHFQAKRVARDAAVTAVTWVRYKCAKAAEEDQRSGRSNSSCTVSAY